MHCIEPLPPVQRALVLEEPRRLTLREIPQWPVAEYGDEDMGLLKVEACGICGSDFRYYLGENPWAQHTLGHFVANPPNIVPGHEFAGTLVAVLSERNSHLLGKRVAPVCSKVCGQCEDCLAGRTRLCPNTMHLGHGQGWGQRDFYPGAYAQYVPVWCSSCFEIAPATAFEDAAMMDILAVCAHVAEVGAVQPGRPVLVLGAGPAGNGIAQASGLLGAGKVVVADVSEQALALLRIQGVGEPVHTEGLSPADAEAKLRAFARGGYGTVFDTVGTAETISVCLNLLGRAGTLVNVAVHDEELALNPMRLGGERRMTTSCNFEVGDYPKALSWLENGRLRVQEWLTRIKLEDAPGWFEKITAGGEKGAFKLVVEPNKGA